MLVHVKQLTVTVGDGMASFRSVLVGMCTIGHSIKCDMLLGPGVSHTCTCSREQNYIPECGPPQCLRRQLSTSRAVLGTLHLCS